MAIHCLLFHLLEEFNSLFFSLDLSLPDQVLSSPSNSVHVLRLKQVIKLIELKALVKERGVHLIGQSHKTYCLIFDLSNQGFVILVLGCDKFGQKVLSVSFSDGFRLVVEDICEVIMILLLSLPHLNERKHKHSAGEEYSRAGSYSSDVLEDLGVLAFNFFEINTQWVEAVIDIIIVSITSYLIVKLFIRN